MRFCFTLLGRSTTHSHRLTRALRGVCHPLSIPQPFNYAESLWCFRRVRTNSLLIQRTGRVRAGDGPSCPRHARTGGRVRLRQAQGGGPARENRVGSHPPSSLMTLVIRPRLKNGLSALTHLCHLIGRGDRGRRPSVVRILELRIHYIAGVQRQRLHLNPLPLRLGEGHSQDSDLSLKIGDAL